jgi:LuxR family transcriptional regulator, maltose regulon positive regulatory protein
MPDQKKILLQTKLHRPPILEGLIERPLLIEQLNHGIQRPLTLVCASAGFGKTTLVCNWLENFAVSPPEAAISYPAAWLSLDEKDSELNVFIRYFIAALRTVFADACEETLMLLQAGKQPPPAALYATLSNEIEQLSDEFILVLDDYHTIHGTEVHDLLNEWARHWPKPLHLALISRINPPIPLASLRAKGMVSEIRTQELRFTAEEAADYMSQAQFVQLNQAALDLLEERFEGWIAGLHLAALSLRSAGSRDSVLSILSSGNANIAGYLVEEVLNHQFPVIQTFLVKTSILDRFCAALCTAVIGEIDAAWNVRAILDWIERSELFITPLDNRQEWHRYHPLFQELLQQRLPAEMAPEEVADLHRRASAWFAEHGLLDEALQHALAAGDLDLAARQMFAGLREVLNNDDLFTLRHWLNLLPVGTVEQRPELLMVKVWFLQYAYQLEAQNKVLQQVEELIENGASASWNEEELQRLRGQILTLYGQQAYFNNQPVQALKYLREAAALLPASWSYLQGGIALYQGMSMHDSGEGKAAERMLQDGYALANHKADGYALRILEGLCHIYLNDGRLEQTRQTAQIILQNANRVERTLFQGWAHFFLGMVYYQWNELELASEHFTEIVKHIYSHQRITARNGVVGLALVHMARGEYAQAYQAIETLNQYDLEHIGYGDEEMRPLHALVCLLDGKQIDAFRWADAFSTAPADQPFLWLENPQFIRARILLARGRAADVQLALQILEVLFEIAGRTHNTRYQIEVQAMRALALDAQGKTGQANAMLKQALDLAQVGGFMRIFVDLGEAMQKILRRLAAQFQQEVMIQRILAAFREEHKNPLSRYSSGQPARHPLPDVAGLIEPLTPRELDVLILLREPLSFKQIAQKLNISYATAKRHTSNLYCKLDVNRRWDAVSRGVELGILPPD